MTRVQKASQANSFYLILPHLLRQTHSIPEKDKCMTNLPDVPDEMPQGGENIHGCLSNSIR